MYRYSPVYLHSPFSVASQVLPYLSTSEAVIAMPGKPSSVLNCSTPDVVLGISLGMPAFTIIGFGKIDCCKRNGCTGAAAKLKSLPGILSQFNFICCMGSFNGLKSLIVKGFAGSLSKSRGIVLGGWILSGLIVLY